MEVLNSNQNDENLMKQVDDNNTQQHTKIMNTTNTIQILIPIHNQRILHMSMWYYTLLNRKKKPMHLYKKKFNFVQIFIIRLKERILYFVGPRHRKELFKDPSHRIYPILST